MIKGLTEKEKFNLIKPLPNEWKKDEKGIPFLKKNNFNFVNWNMVKYASYSNLKSIKEKENTVLLNFQYDKTISGIYSDIFKFAQKVYDCFAVTTPDYSAYMNMEPCKIEENVQHSLWCGAWLQYLGIEIIPTITWADERTYDICFNYIARGSVVTISTIGVSNCNEEFLKGFNEMRKRIDPPLILVRGRPIEGMVGNFVFIDYEETFNKSNNYEQIRLFVLDRIQEIRKDVI